MKESSKNKPTRNSANAANLGATTDFSNAPFYSRDIRQEARQTNKFLQKPLVGNVNDLPMHTARVANNFLDAGLGCVVTIKGGVALFNIFEELRAVKRRPKDIDIEIWVPNIARMTDQQVQDLISEKAILDPTKNFRIDRGRQGERFVINVKDASGLDISIYDPNMPPPSKLAWITSKDSGKLTIDANKTGDDQGRKVRKIGLAHQDDFTRDMANKGVYFSPDFREESLKISPHHFDINTSARGLILRLSFLNSFGLVNDAEIVNFLPAIKFSNPGYYVNPINLLLKELGIGKEIVASGNDTFISRNARNGLIRFMKDHDLLGEEGIALLDSVSKIINMHPGLFDPHVAILAQSPVIYYSPIESFCQVTFNNVLSGLRVEIQNLMQAQERREEIAREQMDEAEIEGREFSRQIHAQEKREAVARDQMFEAEIEGREFSRQIHAQEKREAVAREQMDEAEIEGRRFLSQEREVENEKQKEAQNTKLAKSHNLSKKIKKPVIDLKALDEIAKSEQKQKKLAQAREDRAAVNKARENARKANERAKIRDQREKEDQAKKEKEKIFQAEKEIRMKNRLAREEQEMTQKQIEREAQLEKEQKAESILARFVTNVKAKVRKNKPLDDLKISDAPVKITLEENQTLTKAAIKPVLEVKKGSKKKSSGSAKKRKSKLKQAAKNMYQVKRFADLSKTEQTDFNKVKAFCAFAYLEGLQLMIGKNPSFINVINEDGLNILAFVCSSRDSKPEDVLQVIQFLIASGLNLETLDNNGRSCLHYACNYGYFDIVKEVLLANPSMINHREKNGITPLYRLYILSCANRDVVAITKLLLEHGGDPLLAHQNSTTPLSMVASQAEGQLEELIDVAKILIPKSNLLSQDGFKNSVLIDACLADNFDIAMAILAHNHALINRVNSDGVTPLHIACLNGNVALVKALLDAGADVSILDKNDQTGLHIITQYAQNLNEENCFQMTEMLLDKGVDVGVINNINKTAFKHFEKIRFFKVAKLLLANGGASDEIDRKIDEKINAKIASLTKEGSIKRWQDPYVRGFADNSRKAIDAAAHLFSHKKKAQDDFDKFIKYCVEGNVKFMEPLLHKHPEFVNLCVPELEPPINFVFASLESSESSKLKILELFIQKGLDLKIINKAGSTALHNACSSGNMALISKVLDLEPSLMAIQSNSGFTAFAQTVSGRFQKRTTPQIVKLLLEKGRGINQQVEASLILACCQKEDEFFSYEEVIADLLSENNDPDIMHTALINSVTIGNVNISRMILDHYPDFIDHFNEDNYCALGLACEMANIEMVKMLLSKGANRHIVDLDGMTVLHQLASSSSLSQTENNIIEITELLFEEEIDVCARSEDGKTASDYASLAGMLSLSKLLLIKEFEVKTKKKWDEKSLENPLFTALMLACKEENLDAVTDLVKNDPTLIHASDPMTHETALHYASIGNNLEIIKFLIASNAPLDVKTIKGFTPFLIACSNMKFANAHYLLNVKEAATQVNLEDLLLDDVSAMHILSSQIIDQEALKTDYLALVKAMLQRKVNFNKECTLGNPLLIAAASGNVDVAALLLEEAAILEMDNIETHKDSTLNKICSLPASHPIFQNDSEPCKKVIKLLFQYDVDVKFKNEEGKNTLKVLEEAQVSNPGFADFVKRTYLKKMKGELAKPTKVHSKNNSQNAQLIDNAKEDQNSHKITTDEREDAISQTQLNPTQLVEFRKLNEAFRQQNFIEAENILKIHGAELTDLIAGSAETSLIACYCLDGSSVEYLPKIIKVLSKYNANPMQIDEKGNTNLHYAVLSQNPEVVKIILTNEPALIDLQRADGKTPLNLAAAFEDNPEVCKELLEAKADIFLADSQGFTPFENACQSPTDDAVALVIAKAMGDQKSPIQKETSLFTACKYGKEYLVDQILNFSDLDLVNSQNNRFSTALHKACLFGNYNVILKLLDAGADVNAIDIHGYPVISEILASANEDEDSKIKIIKLLIEHGVDISSLNQFGRSFSDAAESFGYFKMSEYLLREERIKAVASHLPEAQSLTSKMIYVNENKKSFLSEQEVVQFDALSKACRESNLAEIDRIISHNPALITAQNSLTDENILHQACVHGDLEIVQYLVKEANANISLRKFSGTNPFLISCQKCHFDVANYLFDSADINLLDTMFGIQALQLVCGFDGVSEQQLILAQKIISKSTRSINYQTIDTLPPLLVACSRGNYALVEMLLNAGANPNITSSAGVTALTMLVMMANQDQDNDFFLTKEKKEKILKLLVIHGASTNMKNGHNKSFDELWDEGVVMTQTDFQKIQLRNSQEKETEPLLAKHQKLLGNLAIECGNQSLRIGNKLSSLFLKEKKKTALSDSQRQNILDKLLMEASGYGCLEDVQYLLEKGANPNFKIKEGNSALTQACSMRKFDIALYLLNLEEINIIENLAGTNALIPICRNNETIDANAKAVVEKIIDLGVDPNIRYGNNLLLGLASENANLELVQVLLKNNAQVNIRNRLNGNTVMHQILSVSDQKYKKMQANYERIITVLLESRVDLSIENHDGINASNYAIQSNGGVMGLAMQFMIFKYRQLLVEKSDKSMSLAKEQRFVDLMKMCQNASIDDVEEMNLAKEIIKYNPEFVLIHVGQQNTTLLHIATAKGNDALVKILLQSGADANALDINGAMASQFIAPSENAHKIEKLFDSYLDQNRDFFQKMLDICHAFNFDHLSAESEAEVNQIIEKNPLILTNVDHSGNSLLHYACKNKSPLAGILLKNHANIGIKNYNNQTPSSIANQCGDAAFLAFFKEKLSDSLAVSPKSTPLIADSQKLSSGSHEQSK